MLGLVNFPFTFTSSLSMQCRSICSLSAGSWLQDGGWGFVVLLLWSSSLYLAGGFRGASDGCTVSNLFPPWIKEASGPDLTFLPFALPPLLFVACRHLSTALREAVPQPCPSVNPYYPTIVDLAPLPATFFLAALMLFGSTLPSSNLLSRLPRLRARRKQGALQGREGWRGRIQILPLICSEKCPTQRTLTPINPATGCYRC